MFDLSLSQSYIAALTGNENTICDWRLFHDKDKKYPALKLRGRLSDLAETLKQYNINGYGVCININAFKDTATKNLSDIDFIRTHVVDLDDVLTSQASYQAATTSDLPPHFAVQTSTGKFHLYWLVKPYTGNDFYKEQQEKFLTLYGGDSKIIDATRVLRVPGFYHNKKEPHLVTCWKISDRERYDFAEIQKFLADINVVNRIGKRKELGDSSKAAPSLPWLTFALNMIDPNNLSYGEWLATSAAFKQAGWSLTNENNLFDLWQVWCARYESNDVSENLTLWKSLKDTQCGWSHFQRVTNVQAYYNNNPVNPPNFSSPEPVKTEIQTEENNLIDAEILDTFGKKEWFKNCIFIESEGKIFTGTGRFMNQTQFNGKYGGKEFCLKPAGGKLTDDAWKAALRSTDWVIPKVDHVRFLPQKPSFSIILDDLGRKGLNVYIPAKIKTAEGDVTPWIMYLHKIFNTENDVKIFNDYVAHCIKYPGWKIPWAILLQSAKGIGKQMIGDVLKRSIGEMYTYQPDAEELVTGVSQFNGWMSNKILIIVDEVRVGDRNDLMNGLKTIITDRRIAVERKGIDQQMEDNVANWVFFSNHKDAFPIDENERRYCIFYSCLQSAQQIVDAGLNKEYFDSMYHWLEMEDGYKKIANWYLKYPIEKGSLSHRAPETSSYQEVLRIGRSPLRVILDDKIEGGERGFRAGFVSLPMFMKAVAESNIRTKPAEHTLRAIIEQKGYVELGKTKGPVVGEDLTHPSVIYGLKGLSVDMYESSQNT